MYSIIASQLSFKRISVNQQIIFGGVSKERYFASFCRGVPIDQDGNTSLHHAVRNCKSINNLHLTILQLGHSDAATMAKISNNRGYIPIDELDHRNFSQSKHQEIRKLLLPLMKENKTKHLSEQVNINEVLNHYSDNENHLLVENLKLGCTFANEVRALIKESYTHPDMNNLSFDHYVKVKDQITYQRDSIAFGYNNPLFKEPISDLLSPNYVALVARHAVSEARGNCYEFSYLVQNKLIQSPAPIVYGAVVEVVHGDHVFHVIDNRPISNPKKLSNSAVICDSWAGDVFPESEIPERLNVLKVFENQDSIVNVPVSYNPKFDSLRILSTGSNQINVTLKRKLFDVLDVEPLLHDETKFYSIDNERCILECPTIFSQQNINTLIEKILAQGISCYKDTHANNTFFSNTPRIIIYMSKQALQHWLKQHNANGCNIERSDSIPKVV